MASSQYTSDYPSSTEIYPAYKTFFEEFYQISDTPDAHEKYADQFTPNATLIMASKRVQGTQGRHVLLQTTFTSFPIAI